MRYFLELAYKGTHFHGWQAQENAYTIQQALEDAIKIILRKPIPIVASGRTDTGVHAIQQFVHLDLEDKIDDYLLYRLNKILSQDIVIKDFFRVIDKASARFDAISRKYEYRISAQKNPFQSNLVYEFYPVLNIDDMNSAAQMLKCHKDFKSFSKVKTDVNHFNCNILDAYWEKKGQELVFNIEANRFLRGMVRAIVGTLIQVGLGKINKNEFEDIILKKDRKAAGFSVSPDGLFLLSVKYPKEIFIDRFPQ